MKRLVEPLANIFGYILLLLCVLVVAETVGRKLFNFSLQGVDELGGYILALGSGIAFTVAYVDRAHIRIDLVHGLLPVASRALLTWVSTLLMALFAITLLYVGWLVLVETREFGSTAPTPWATPLIWPQSVWLASLAVFAGITVLAAIRATILCLARRYSVLEQEFGPKVAEEELREELENLRSR
ncbi:MAG TPA: TRAP transporter small permease [Azospirillum sp.]|nr:TRAP transporter small permease [Azospirillum sp.]